MQTALDFPSTLILKDNSNWKANKSEHGEGIMLIRTFVLKVISNDRKILIPHEIIDCIAENIVSVITQVC